MTDTSQGELRSHLVTDAIRRHLWLVLVPALILAPLGFLWAETRQANYQSTVRVLLRPLPGNPFAPDSAGTSQQQTVALTTESLVAVSAPVVDRADAADWLAVELAEPVAGVCTVVTHSIVFQYLAPTSARAVLATLDAAGARATTEAPLAWLRMEPGGDQAELRLTVWPSGTTHLLATSAYHGPPVVWRAPEGGVLRPVARR